MIKLVKKILDEKKKHTRDEATDVKFIYVDRGGILHGSSYEDTASVYGKGVYMATDEI